MTMLVTIFMFLIMLGILVFVHELGHFVVARWMGVRVEEFGIGYPPRAVTLFERDGVKYTLNWLPIGGFVRFGGEDNTLYGTGSLAAASPWRKIPVMVAGPLMNLFLAIVIFAILFISMGIPVMTDTQLINAVFPETPAAAAGFQPDDILVSLDGQRVTGPEIIEPITRTKTGQPLPAVVERDGQQLTLTVIPGPWSTPDGQQFQSGLGISYGPIVTNEPAGLPRAIIAAVTYTGEILVRMLQGFGALLGGLFGLNEAPAGGVAGPLGIARATGEVIDQGGLPGFWNWTAVLSLNLFILNLLPIPALDGSHIMFSLIEWIRGGKKVPPEKEALVHAIGFATLMALMLLITVSDVLNAISGNPVLGGG